MPVLFGPSGNSESFYAAGKKHTLEAPRWLFEMGLDAYEYSAGNGITASLETFAKIGAEARKYGIKTSFHTPYYISLSGVEIEKRLKSIDYIQKSVDASEALGADIIVIHMGSAAKISREVAVSLAKDTLDKALLAIPDTNVRFGLETMGKINQLGTLSEVIELCKMDNRLVPVVDFGHMNAREVGGYFVTSDDYRRVFDKIALGCSDYVAKNLHCHFSKIEYTQSGEKKHLTFDDTMYGPEFEPLIEAIVKEGLTPRIICESAGTQAEDAKAMKNYYEKLL